MALPGRGKPKSLEQKEGKTWDCRQDWDHSPFMGSLKLSQADVYLRALGYMRATPSHNQPGFCGLLKGERACGRPDPFVFPKGKALRGIPLFQQFNSAFLAHLAAGVGALVRSSG